VNALIKDWNVALCQSVQWATDSVLSDAGSGPMNPLNHQQLNYHIARIAQSSALPEITPSSPPPLLSLSLIHSLLTVSIYRFTASIIIIIILTDWSVLSQCWAISTRSHTGALATLCLSVCLSASSRQRAILIGQPTAAAYCVNRI